MESDVSQDGNVLYLSIGDNRLALYTTGDWVHGERKGTIRKNNGIQIRARGCVRPFVVEETTIHVVQLH
eukprot:4816721-Pleurochrysis_carterae.AAC.1